MIPDTLTERAATPDDAPAIAALIRALSGPSLLSPDGAGAEKFFASVGEAAQRGYLADPRYDYRVLVDGDGRVVALGAVRDGRHLFHLFVEPAWQGRGLARGLWQRLQAAARTRGHPGAFTVNATLPALGVYRRFGFVESGDVQRVNGIAFQPMALALPESAP